MSTDTILLKCSIRAPQCDKNFLEAFTDCKLDCGWYQILESSLGYCHQKDPALPWPSTCTSTTLTTPCLDFSSAPASTRNTEATSYFPTNMDEDSTSAPTTDSTQCPQCSSSINAVALGLGLGLGLCLLIAIVLIIVLFVKLSRATQEIHYMKSLRSKLTLASNANLTSPYESLSHSTIVADPCLIPSSLTNNESTLNREKLYSPSSDNCEQIQHASDYNVGQVASSKKNFKVPQQNNAHSESYAAEKTVNSNRNTSPRTLADKYDDIMIVDNDLYTTDAYDH